MITENYCSFEVAKLLKEKGFNEPIRCWYDNFQDFHESGVKMRNSDCINPTIMCPTHQMAMKWLREAYKLEVRSTYDYDKDSWWGNINPMFEETDENTNVYQKALRFDYQGKSYEEAVEAALKYVLENLI